MRKSIWTSTKCTTEKANKLCDTLNKLLSDPNKGEVIQITNEWYMIVGNNITEQRLKELSEALAKVLGH